MARSTSRAHSALGALVLLCAAPALTRADTPAKPATPAEPPRVYGELRTYIRGWQDTSPEDRATQRFRLPFLQTVYVGSNRVGVKGLSIEALGYGEIESVEPLVGNRGRGDLLMATIAWRGLPNDMLMLKAGRQIVHVGAANNAIIDGFSGRLELPLSFTLEAWGGFTAEPGFDWGTDRWQAGARAAWSPFDVGHLGVSFAQERMFGEPSRELVGIDFAWRQFKWLDTTGYFLIDDLSRRLQEAELYIEGHPTREWQLQAEYRHVDVAARIPKTSIFSVFSNATYDQAGGWIGFFPLNGMLSLFGGASVLVYDADDIGYRARLRARLLLDRRLGNLIGIELGRVGTGTSGYWQTRAYGMWSPTSKLHLTGDVDFGVYDDSARTNGHRWSNVSRLTAAVDLFAGGRLMADVSVLVSPTFSQQWAGMLRFTYDLSGRLPEPLMVP